MTFLSTSGNRTVFKNTLFTMEYRFQKCSVYTSVVHTFYEFIKLSSTNQS